MYKNDAKLFGDAVLNGIINRFERELADNTESAGYSEAHEAAMLEIIATSKAIEQRMGKKRLIAILVAAALLLLVGCTAYVYRNQIGSFVETFFENSVNIGFADEEKNDITTIEEVYELTYIPEGYTLKEKHISEVNVTFTYYDKEQNVVWFDQCPLGASNNFVLDNDTQDASVFEHNGIEIYVRLNTKTRHYFWENDKYAMSLTCSTSISQDEILKIIDGISG